MYCPVDLKKKLWSLRKRVNDQGLNQFEPNF